MNESNIIIQKKFPNVIIFTHNDADGILAAMLIKQKYDNNLINENWQRNVQTYCCEYTKEYNLQWFKEKFEQNFQKNQKNIVFVLDYSLLNDDLLKFWNYTTDKTAEFYWIDHHISAIEKYKHLNIPGLQSSLACACYNTFVFLNKNQNKNIPLCINYINDFELFNKESNYSFDKEIYPLIYFIESLGLQINDNTNQLVTNLNELLLDNQLLKKFVLIGKYVFKYKKNIWKNNLKNIKNIQWNNLNCIVVNSLDKGTMQFEQYQNYKQFDLMIVWYFSGQQYIYSLYSQKENINCAELAKQFLNGGGHKNAAGRTFRNINFLK